MFQGDLTLQLTYGLSKQEDSVESTHISYFKSNLERIFYKMALNPLKQNVKAFESARYKHVRSENIDAFINYMGKLQTRKLSKCDFKLKLQFRLWFLQKQKTPSRLNDCPHETFQLFLRRVRIHWNVFLQKSILSRIRSMLSWVFLFQRLAEEKVAFWWQQNDQNSRWKKKSCYDLGIRWKSSGANVHCRQCCCQEVLWENS